MTGASQSERSCFYSHRIDTGPISDIGVAIIIHSPIISGPCTFTPEVLLQVTRCAINAYGIFDQISFNKSELLIRLEPKLKMVSTQQVHTAQFGHT